MKLNKYIDHTLLKATATKDEIRKLCKEAVKNDFYAVCVNSCFVEYAKQYLEDSDVKLAAVIGFPLGAMDIESKVYEAKKAIDLGADEIDMVINIGFLKSCDYLFVRNEIEAVKNVIGDKVLKVILETCYLTDEEIIVAAQLAINAKADFIKTSTGFGTSGAEIKDVALMKEVVCDFAKIKASGGIKNKETAELFIAAGADRIGTSSGIAIVSE
ncbi:MAG: deoxyribose-phosphate aldolase [Flavobacteriaceae bacterium]|nr:deoxyribose-phosphate aldolase [Flavobacteriaceae bacterium]|tara:strand:- start:55110 stop:55751 length:642 start_codon:yes stop_codon:yes gene_type:complete